MKDPALLRDALATLLAVRDSDLRYQGKDCSAYFAYLLAARRAGAGVWEAQKAVHRSRAQETAAAEGAPDPVLTVDTDGSAFEVFSRRRERPPARASPPSAPISKIRTLPTAPLSSRCRPISPRASPACARTSSWFTSTPAPPRSHRRHPRSSPEPAVTERTASVTDAWLKSSSTPRSPRRPAIAPVDLTTSST
ncbi:MAG: hypothetical protein R3B70_00135 [Polyangiaceae bacterium]